MKRRTFFRSAAAAAAAATIPIRSPLEASFLPVGRRSRDVRAITGDGREVTLTSSAIEDLNARMFGRVLLADDAGYEDARRILNPAFDKRPALIVQPAGSVDIRHAVDFAQEHGGLLTAVKCGGHSHSGKSTCDYGMQIDLSNFRDVRVDPVARTARVTGGSLLGQLDHESMAYDLVAPMGTVSHTGVGGLVTGGGFGRLARRFGMSIDSLLSADVVTADGRLVHASDDENPELFWGIRGGGGNFGIVTSFEFRLHPMQRQVLGGGIMYPISRARDVLNLYGDYGFDAPDEIQIDCALVIPPGGAPGMAGFQVCYSGSPGRADAALGPLRSLGTPMMDDVGPTDYVALQRSGDVDDFRTAGGYLKSGFISDMSANLVSAIVDGFEGDPGRLTTLAFQQGGGAISRVGNSDTSFSHRTSQANMLGILGWTHGIDASEHIAWIRSFWPALEPSIDGFYGNDLDEEITAAGVNANFGGNYQRLLALKNRYDPTNLFRLNANIEPSA